MSLSTPTKTGTGTVPQESNAGSSISLKGLRKTYGSVTAVDGIDLDIQPGEFVTLLGPSGSGKTTTLSMISGFEQATSGDIFVSGRRMTNVPAHKREIGLVFQHYALFPHMTVAENIEFPLKQRKISRDKRKQLIENVLATVRLEGYGSRYPAQLSGGQQQRVALARAIVFKPSVLLMDEPLGALDRKLRDWLHMEIKRIHRELGSTFVYVTHDQEEALVLSDRVAIFQDGKIAQIGTGETLYEQPANLFVGRFIGESTILSGGVVARHDGTDMTIQGRPIHVPTVAGFDGKTGVVLVRPERMCLAAAGEMLSDGVNHLPAVVSEVTYLGPAVRYSLRFGDGTVGTVRVGASNRRDFGLGESVEAYWRPEHGVLLEPDSTSDPTQDD